MNVTEGGLVNVTEGGLVNMTEWPPVGRPHFVEGVHVVDVVGAKLFCLQLE